MMHTLKQTAEKLSISEPTLRRRIRAKEIKAYKDGGVWKIESEWIDQYQEKLLQKQY